MSDQAASRRDDAPFDAGLQPERTLLAWRRTCLSLAVAGLLIVRFAADRLGAAAIVAGLLGLLLAGIAYLDAARRYRVIHRHLSAGNVLPSAGVQVALAASATAVFGIACAVWLVTVY